MKIFNHPLPFILLSLFASKIIVAKPHEPSLHGTRNGTDNHNQTQKMETTEHTSGLSFRDHFDTIRYREHNIIRTRFFRTYVAMQIQGGELQHKLDYSSFAKGFRSANKKLLNKYDSTIGENVIVWSRFVNHYYCGIIPYSISIRIHATLLDWPKGEVREHEAIRYTFERLIEVIRCFVIQKKPLENNLKHIKITAWDNKHPYVDMHGYRPNIGVGLNIELIPGGIECLADCCGIANRPENTLDGNISDDLGEDDD